MTSLNKLCRMENAIKYIAAAFIVSVLATPAMGYVVLQPWAGLDPLCYIATLMANIAAAIAVIVIISAGLKWVTSGDAPGDRKAAKNMIIHAIVGLIIIMVYAIFINFASTINPCK
ncbi:Uncharacterised protein [uncultured archaeon]|nr:Uncharacterised protein [uncultured archaeon]